MTVNQLIKKLEKIRDQYGKRVHVAIDLAECSVNPSIIRDYSHWSVSDVSVESVIWEKDDSCILADGSERYKTVASIKL